MARTTPVRRLKAIEREELDAAVEAWAARELRPHGIPEWLGAQFRLWNARLNALAGWVQLVIKLAPILSFLGAGYKLACFMLAHQVSPADLPATGIASTTLDRVQKPAAVVGRDGAVNPPRRTE